MHAGNFPALCMLNSNWFIVLFVVTLIGQTYALVVVLKTWILPSFSHLGPLMKLLLIPRLKHGPPNKQQ